MDTVELKTLSRRKVNLSVYMPMSLVEVLDRIADSEGVTTNHVTMRLLRKALAIERDERAAKDAAS